MESAFPYEIYDHEIYRYLGYRGQTPDEAVLKKIATCKENLLRDVTPKAIWKYIIYYFFIYSICTYIKFGKP